MQIPKRENFSKVVTIQKFKTKQLLGPSNGFVSKIIRLCLTLWETDLSYEMRITSHILQDSYTVPRITTLKLKKSHVWSVDSNILDYRGFYVFRKAGSNNI